MTQAELEEKIKLLKPSQILDYMIKGLENPFTQIKMITYGDYAVGENNEIVCFGCAATNAICLLAEINTKSEFVRAYDEGLINTGYDGVLIAFESAVNRLRQGNIQTCNYKLKEYSEYRFPKIKIKLPYLDDNYTPEQLSLYKEYMNECIKQGL